MATVDERLRQMALSIERVRVMLEMLENRHQANRMDSTLLGLRQDVREVVAEIHGVRPHEIPCASGPDGFWSKESVMAYIQLEGARNVQDDA